MDGRNCTGRRISLLNDSSDTAGFASKIQLPSLATHSRAPSSSSHTSTSRTSTPSLSPAVETPQFSVSPLTPSSNNYESHHIHRESQQQQHYFFSKPYAKMDDPHATLYPPIPDATGGMPAAYPMPQAIPQQISQPNHQIYRASNSPQSEPSRVSTVSAASNSKVQQPKKNHYP